MAATSNGRVAATKKQARRHVAGGAVTSGYRPNLWHAAHYGPSDLPGLWRLLWDVPLMQAHPRVELALSYYKSASATAEMEVKSKTSQEVADFAKDFIDKFWAEHLAKVQTAYDWGWFGAEPVYEADSSGRLEMVDMLPFLARDVKPLVRDHKYVGFRVEMSYAHLDELSQRDGGPRVVKLPSSRISKNAKDGKPDIPAKGFWFAHNTHYHPLFGRSQLYAAWRPWSRLARIDGAENVVDAGFYRAAFQGPVVRYPVDNPVDDNDRDLTDDNRNRAREMAENVKAGASVAMPSTRDEKGNPDWDLQWAEFRAQGMEACISYVEYLRAEIDSGVGVPSELIEAAETGSGYSGRQIPMEAFLLAQQRNAEAIVRAVCEQILDPLIRWNFGPDAEAEVTVKNLLETKAQQAQGQDAGGMMPQGMPPQAGPGGMAGPTDAMPGAAEEGQEEEEEEEDDPLSLLLGGGNLSTRRLADDTVEMDVESFLSLARLGQHAPAGGITVGGREFKGGQFVPSEAIDDASPDELAKLRGAKAEEARADDKAAPETESGLEDYAVSLTAPAERSKKRLDPTDTLHELYLSGDGSEESVISVLGPIAADLGHLARRVARKAVRAARAVHGDDFSAGDASAVREAASDLAERIPDILSEHLVGLLEDVTDQRVALEEDYRLTREEITADEELPPEDREEALAEAEEEYQSDLADLDAEKREELAEAWESAHGEIVEAMEDLGGVVSEAEELWGRAGEMAESARWAEQALEDVERFSSEPSEKDYEEAAKRLGESMEALGWSVRAKGGVLKVHSGYGTDEEDTDTFDDELHANLEDWLRDEAFLPFAWDVEDYDENGDAIVKLRANDDLESLADWAADRHGYEHHAIEIENGKPKVVRLSSLRRMGGWDGPKKGPRGGTYYENTETGERRYQEDRPRADGEQSSRESARKSHDELVSEWADAEHQMRSVAGDALEGVSDDYRRVTSPETLLVNLQDSESGDSKTRADFATKPIRGLAGRITRVLSPAAYQAADAAERHVKSYFGPHAEALGGNEEWEAEVTKGVDRLTKRAKSMERRMEKAVVDYVEKTQGMSEEERDTAYSRLYDRIEGLADRFWTALEDDGDLAQIDSEAFREWVLPAFHAAEDADDSTRLSTLRRLGWDGPKKGPRGGTYYVHRKTGRKVYGEKPPGKKGKGKKDGAKAEKSTGRQQRSSPDKEATRRTVLAELKGYRRTGEATPREQAKTLGRMMSMTKADILAIKKEMGVKASGTKSELAKKVIERSKVRDAEKKRVEKKLAETDAKLEKSLEGKPEKTKHFWRELWHELKEDIKDVASGHVFGERPGRKPFTPPPPGPRIDFQGRT